MGSTLDIHRLHQFELRRNGERNAFFASCAYLLGMLTSVVTGVYPMVLPARNPGYSLTVANAKAADYGLKIWLDRVDHWRDSRRRLFHLRLPNLRRESHSRHDSHGNLKTDY